MEQNDVISLVAMETVGQNRWRNRSAGSVYVLLIALVIGTISLANLLNDHWQIPRYIVQLSIYATTAVCGVIWYRAYAVRYRYTLTDRMFAIERMTARSEQTIMAVSLEEILELEIAGSGAISHVRVRNASVLPRRKSTILCVDADGTKTLYAISPSEDFITKFTAQLHAVRSRKER